MHTHAPSPLCPNQVRVYYMGGNGPHNGPRNTSLGLATLRTDGFGGLSGRGTAVTVPLTVTGGALTVTCDMLDGGMGGGEVRVGAVGVDGLGAADAVPVASNSTDARVRFAKGASFATLVGRTVALEIVVDNAMVYTVGFEQV